MTITLTPETETRLVEEAQRNGQDINHLADVLIADGLTHRVVSQDPDDLTEDQLTEIRAGVERGLEAAAAGRVTPLAEAVAQTRRRHGFPATWASGVNGPV